MVMPGLINLDFADIRAVMSEMGKAMMGTGEAEGERRALDAAEAAISNPLLDDVSMKGARGVLINITGGMDMTLFEVDEAANRIRDEVDPDANIIFGSTFDPVLEGKVRVSVVATGIESAAMQQPKPTRLAVVSERPAAAVRVMTPAAALNGQAPIAAPIAANEPLRPTARLEPVLAQHPAMAEVAPAMPTPAPRIAVSPAVFPSPAPFPQPSPAMAQPRAPEPAANPAEAYEHDRHFLAPRPVEPMSSMTRGPMSVEPTGSGPLTASPSPAASGPNGQGMSAEARPAKRRLRLFDRVSNSVRAATEAKPEPVAPVQPRLGGLEPGDRLQISKSEDDLLEIPAFLRRQAN
jgi:cell division protein FtsZ